MGRATRKYSSDFRREQSIQTKNRILASARELFAVKGFEKTTIEKIAHASKVSIPTVYFLYKSKVGILRELMNQLVFGEEYRALVLKIRSLEDPIETIKMVSTVARHVLDAEEAQMGFVRGASALFPELRKLEAEIEKQRYDRQAFIIHRLEAHGLLKSKLKTTQAREILWALTGREIYRKLVIERGWSSAKYAGWITESLMQILVQN